MPEKFTDISATDLEQFSADEKRALLKRLLQGKSEVDLSEYPLSYNQRALWFLHRLVPDEHAYNILFCARVTPPVDVAVLEDSLKHVVKRHPALRTIVVLRDGEPYQRVMPTNLDFQHRDMRGWHSSMLDRVIAEEGERPFNLEHELPMRVRLYRIADDVQILHCVFHHIAFDAWSLSIFFHELRACYEAALDGRQPHLPPLSTTYRNFVHAQSRLLSGEMGERLWSYWQSQLRSPLPQVNLPADRERPTHYAFHGGSVAFCFQHDLSRAIQALGRSVGVTSHMLLLSALQVLLHRYTGASDILIGSPVAGRGEARFASVIGYFVNMVVLRCDLSEDPVFLELARQTRIQMLQALEHQDYPFPLLVERLQARRTPGRNPIFDVVLNLIRPQSKDELADLFIGSGHTNGVRFGLSRLLPHVLPQQEGQVDLAIVATEVSGSITGHLKYNANIFDRETAESILRDYERLLCSIIANPDERVSRLNLRPPAELREVFLDSDGVGKQNHAEPVEAVRLQSTADKREGNMTAMGLLTRLSTLDIRLWLEGDRLRCSAPAGVLSPELRTELRDRKAELVSLLQSNEQSLASLASDRPANSNQTLLSFSQQRVWFLQQMEPENPTYNIWGITWIHGVLNVAALEMAIAEIIRRHESLRIAFVRQEGEPHSVIGGIDGWKMQTLDLTALPLAVGKQESRRVATREGSLPFDLTRSPLLRVMLMRCAENIHGLFLCFHHIVFDGLSFGVFVKELAVLYKAFSEERPSPLPELPLQYSDFARWQRTRWNRGVIIDQLNYWKKQLGGKLPVLDLPTDHARPPIQTFHGSRYAIMISGVLTETVRELSSRERSTLFMTLLTAFKTLLFRYTGLEDVLVGTPVSGRHRLEDELLFGFFANTLVLRTDLSGNPTFRDLLARVREIVLDAYANDEVPFDRLVEVLRPERTTSHSPVFQVLFTLQPVSVQSIEMGTATLILDEDTGPQIARYDLAVDVVEKDDGLKISFEYNTSLFEEASIRRVAEHFKQLLESIVANPDQRIAELQFLTDREREQVLVEWNSTQSDYPSELCVHQLIQTQASKTPQCVAVQFGDIEWTYAELDKRADKLALHLQKLGVGPEVLVGVCLERSPLMVLAVLATMKAGGAYVPMDPTFPQERLDFMVSDARVSVLLTHAHLAASLAIESVHVVYLDFTGEVDGEFDPERPVSKVTPDNLAYVIYTSGSTGRPKGVQLTHRSLVNFLASMRRQPGLTEHDRLLSVTTLSFDIAGLELYLPLITGARIVLASRGVATDALRLIELLEQSGATVMQATPATWKMLIEAGWEGTRGLKILCGGEALSQDLADQLLARGASLWNMYGPTETTIWSTLSQVDSGEKRVAIGRPIANTQVYVLDPQLQPVPVGVVGELFIGGDGLARGYLNRPELTQEKFISHPFSPNPLARLYQTGDQARYCADGTIECLGRVDHQVKIRGFRIELGEIEACLSRYSGIRQAVVVAREDGTGERRLAAYLVTESGTEVGVAELRDSIKKSLPDYMIPSAFVFMDALPLTPNGKVDRNALPAPSSQRLHESSFIAPRTQLEQTVASIWCEVLEVDKVGLDDNFFDLGGHSLSIVKVHSKLCGRLGCNLTLVDLFQSPTIAALANRLNR